MDVVHHPKSAIRRRFCHRPVLLLGMEMRKVADSPQYAIPVQSHSGCIPSLMYCLVYIFKHSTVTGVYITMFIK